MKQSKNTVSVKCSLCNEQYSVIIASKGDIKNLACKQCHEYKLKEAK